MQEMGFSGSKENSVLYSSILLERISTHPCAGIRDRNTALFFIKETAKTSFLLNGKH
jgi:hypothetical protein